MQVAGKPGVDALDGAQPAQAIFGNLVPRGANALDGLLDPANEDHRSMQKYFFSIIRGYRCMYSFIYIFIVHV
jgi:hypothetical protein